MRGGPQGCPACLGRPVQGRQQAHFRLAGWLVKCSHQPKTVSDKRAMPTGRRCFAPAAPASPLHPLAPLRPLKERAG